MSETRLTYCGNVHPAENLDGWLAAVEQYSVPVAAAQTAPFGLGAWWCAEVARELAADETARDRVRDLLGRHGLELWTLNVFPFGGFHEERVKEAVYRPDWASDERVRYTLDAATAVSALVPAGRTVPLSTLPLGFRCGDVAPHAQQLRGLADALADLEQRTGVRCVVALEPEPFCELETAAQTLAFFEDHLLAGVSEVQEHRIRRFLGVCIDLCHLAVVGESPLAALADLASSGIEVPKIQVSSCLELRDPAALPQLLAFDEPRYLHQTVAENGARALDLPEVADRAAEFAQAGVTRTHYHMPIFWDAETRGSTRRQVEEVLGGLGRPGLRDAVLEVETYTWDVLDQGTVGSGDLVADLCQELAFARNRLQT